MDNTLSYPITTAVMARKAAYVDPATGVAVVPNAAKVKCLGLFTLDVAAAEGMAPVQTAGIAPAVFGAAADFGASLTTDAQGRLVTAAGASGDKVWCVGFSEAKVAQADDIADVRIHPHLVVI